MILDTAFDIQCRQRRTWEWHLTSCNKPTMAHHLRDNVGPLVTTTGSLTGTLFFKVSVPLRPRYYVVVKQASSMPIMALMAIR